MSEPLIDPAKRPDDFLRWLSSEGAAVIYASALEVQTELNESQIRAVLERLDAWGSSQEVLDVGCGPGNFPHKLSQSKNVEFICGDLFKFRGRRFDAIYLWAVLQHLPSVKDALQHLRTLLKPGGSIILFDSSEDEDVRLRPLARSVRCMYDELRRLSRSKGRNDDCVGNVKRLAGRFGFEVVFEEPVHVPIVSAKAKEQFVRYVTLVSELLERFYSIHSDRRRILSDLNRWSNSKASSAELGGGRWLLLQQTKAA